MNREDTIHLLGECNAGIRMAVSSIEEILPAVHDSKMKDRLYSCLDEHKVLGDQTHEQLLKWDSDGKDPNPIAKGMSWLKTNVKLSIDSSDTSAADLLTDGCNMGVKSLNQYKNKYTDADSHAVKLTDQIIDSEQRLADDLRNYL